MFVYEVADFSEKFSLTLIESKDLKYVLIHACFENDCESIRVFRKHGSFYTRTLNGSIVSGLKWKSCQQSSVYIGNISELVSSPTGYELLGEKNIK